MLRLLDEFNVLVGACICNDHGRLSAMLRPRMTDAHVALLRAAACPSTAPRAAADAGAAAAACVDREDEHAELSNDECEARFFAHMRGAGTGLVRGARRSAHQNRNGGDSGGSSASSSSSDDDASGALGGAARALANAATEEAPVARLFVSWVGASVRELAVNAHYAQCRWMPQWKYLSVRCGRPVRAQARTPRAAEVQAGARPKEGCDVVLRAEQLWPELFAPHQLNATSSDKADRPGGGGGGYGGGPAAGLEAAARMLVPAAAGGGSQPELLCDGRPLNTTSSQAALIQSLLGVGAAETVADCGKAGGGDSGADAGDAASARGRAAGAHAGLRLEHLPQSALLAAERIAFSFYRRDYELLGYARVAPEPSSAAG
jgi:hypothetical protein